MLPEQIAVTMLVADALEALDVRNVISGCFASMSWPCTTAGRRTGNEVPRKESITTGISRNLLKRMHMIGCEMLTPHTFVPLPCSQGG